MQTLCLCSAVAQHLAKGSLGNAEQHCATKVDALALALIVGIAQLTVECDWHSSSS